MGIKEVYSIRSGKLYISFALSEAKVRNNLAATKYLSAYRKVIGSEMANGQAAV